MATHKTNLADLSTKALVVRRRRLAGRLADVQQVLSGSVSEQMRRCGKPGCRCTSGRLHGPYVYFTPRPNGRGRSRLVPAELVSTVRDWLRRGDWAQQVLAEIGEINTELLSRRELG